MNFENLKDIYTYPNFTDSMEVANNPQNLIQYKTRKFVNNKALQHPIYLEFFTEKSGNTPGEPYMGLIRLKAKKFKFQM
jgi:hypothetical protein